MNAGFEPCRLIARLAPGNQGFFLPITATRREIVGTWKRAEKSAGVKATPDPVTVCLQYNGHRSHRHLQDLADFELPDRRATSLKCLVHP